MKKSTYLSRAITVRKFAMYKSNNGDYPYLIKGKAITNISGEIYMIKRKEVLNKIDAFEDSPSYYTRERIEVITRSGKVRAFTYFYVNKTEHKSKESLEFWDKPEEINVDDYFDKLLGYNNE
jgi:gamma-glutamylcyclotransferase (GGCT)/AIG2-like uncharacterized protein YtfP